VSGQRGGGRLAAVAAVAVAALLALVIPGLAANGSGDGAIRPDAEAVLSPLGMSIANPPNPVLGADGRYHLAYEITIVNQSPATVAIEQVQPRAGGTPFGPPLEGAALEALLRVNGGGGPAIPGGGSALLFMDVTYDKGVAAPRLLTHGFTITVRNPAQPDQTLEFIGVATRVGQGRAIEVAPPLRGPGWVTAEGCCSPINSHRGATLSIDGTVRVPERFAIDFVQLNADDRLFTGPIDELSSYAYFGVPIHSATAGTVVGLQDGRPEQTPGALPTGQTIQTAGGNYVVVRIAKGRFAFYAHMQPRSLRVGIGDRVRAGQVLGLLGNTGNTDAPHLHFHIMDGPSPLQSNGLPFVFTSFTGEGRVTDLAALVAGEVTPIDLQDLAGAFRGRMPLGYQVVDFGP
jgi:Peptidase family M23